MPFVIRKNEGHYNLVGACFVDDIMEGEAVQAMKAGTSPRGLFNPERVLSKLYDFDAFPAEAREVLQEVQEKILERTGKEYDVLKEELIELG